MTPARRHRLTLVLLGVSAVSLAVGLGLYALGHTVDLFFSPSQVVAGEAPEERNFRIGGLVEEGTVRRGSESLKVSFDLTDGGESVTVHHEGVLPDMFREGQGIVALGRLDGNGGFHAEQVLAKHDENYMPPEVAESLEAVARAKEMDQ